MLLTYEWFLGHPYLGIVFEQPSCCTYFVGLASKQPNEEEIHAMLNRYELDAIYRSIEYELEATCRQVRVRCNLDDVQSTSATPQASTCVLDVTNKEYQLDVSLMDSTEDEPEMGTILMPSTILWSQGDERA